MSKATPAVDVSSQGDPVAAVEQVVQQLFHGLMLGLRGIGEVRGLLSASDDGLLAEGSSWALAHGIALVVLLSAAASSLAVFYLFRSFLHQQLAGNDTIGHLNRALRQLVVDLIALAVFVGVARLLEALITSNGSYTQSLVRAIVMAVIVALCWAILGRLLFSPNEARVRLVEIARPRWHWTMLVIYGAIGAFFAQTVRLGYAKGADPLALEGWFFMGTTILTVVKLLWFIGGARDMRRAFAGREPGRLRCVAAYCLPAFYVLTALLIWLASGLAAGTPQSPSWISATGSTQIVLLFLPVLALGTHALAAAVIRRVIASGERTHFEMAMLQGLQVLLTGAIWLTGIYLIFRLWRPILTDTADAPALHFLIQIERVILAVVLAFAFWSFLRTFFERLAPSKRPLIPGTTDDGGPVASAGRLSTVMPIIRNIAFGAILAILGLVVLSSIGVDIGPLIAGFGILGLAISFGSQTLVKDIVSGIFFIADDAFRVGEYVDSGRLKGTVERITLRSLQLRHQNGPLNTIPFGQIQSITNYSRDWSTIKFEMRFDRDADPERIRKTVKRVGLEMLEDPDMGPQFLVPLKMQGIQDVTENSIVIRFKFTAKPGNPSLIQRQAMKRLLIAFKEAGIVLSSNAVVVRGGPDSHSSGAAAATASAMAMEAAAQPG
ncbi:mechanosensitive ion channel family protein [Mesorhizobium sp. CN2-181]|uniref:mechanosensitive ion channel family protein n=1 Tax=Mesorhizobium TaxID=68287 RepID=UPI0032B6FF7A